MKLKIFLLLCFVFSVFSNGINAQFPERFRLSDSNVFVGQKFRLGYSQVFCTFSRVLINSETIKTIDSIINFLNNNPEVTIEIADHTDQRGSAKANLSMSQKRAESFKFQICEKGKIDSERIVAIGYGEENPIIPLDTILKLSKEAREPLYQQNRRFVIEVLEGKDYYVELRKKVEYQIYQSRHYEFSDTNVEVNQTKKLYGISTSLSGKILKDSLGYLDSLIVFLVQNNDVNVSIIDVTNNYGELDLDSPINSLVRIQEQCIKNYLVDNGNINSERISINATFEDDQILQKIETAPLSSSESKEWKTFIDSFMREREFFVVILKSKTSFQKKNEFKNKDKVKILKKLESNLTAKGWEQSTYIGDMYLGYKYFTKHHLSLINKKTWMNNKNRGISVSVFEKENKDLVLLKDWTMDGSESKIIFTKSYVIQIDYITKWSPYYDEIIEKTISEIEQFFKENYEKL